MKNRGITYIDGGWVWGNVLSDHPFPDGYYLYQYEPIRKATLLEKVTYFAFGKRPKREKTNGNQ